MYTLTYVFCPPYYRGAILIFMCKNLDQPLQLYMYACIYALEQMFITDHMSRTCQVTGLNAPKMHRDGVLAYARVEPMMEHPGQP
ncbi:Fibrocystin [Clarias magur]|uniref:Fibrocystin n=1 Tax=Clarias magur TaxID=1594786 RepID=A0A8J4X0X6_CLAMG|nr:Fibrocystin [Clarias magur]